MTTIERAFAALAANDLSHYDMPARWQRQMQIPVVRAYHNEMHVAAVLECIWVWEPKPSRALVAAALYHDAVYDPMCRDNESLSAAFCRSELEALGYVSEAEISKAVRLIELTASHQAGDAISDSDAVLLLDADLFTLGDTPEKYASYVEAIRTEYAHVSDAAWREGRASIMRHFLERERIYEGTWDGHAAREAQARANIADEIAQLA